MEKYPVGFAETGLSRDYFWHIRPLPVLIAE